MEKKEIYEIIQSAQLLMENQYSEIEGLKKLCNDVFKLIATGDKYKVNQAYHRLTNYPNLIK